MSEPPGGAVANARLSVNLNKIALLRNSRGDDAVPRVVDAARTVLAAGCLGITVHPRPDQRHIKPHDVTALRAMLPKNAELNIEGNPFAGATNGGYPGLLSLVEATRPAQCTLVPDADGQLTSDHGFDFEGDLEPLRKAIQQLKSWGCRVSLFVDAGTKALARAAEIGAHRVEIYTGPFAHAFARGRCEAELLRCVQTATHAKALGLGVNAGHDLDQKNLTTFLVAVPNVLEVSIGHALIAEALDVGLAPTVVSYLRIIERVKGARS